MSAADFFEDDEPRNLSRPRRSAAELLEDDAPGRELGFVDGLRARHEGKDQGLVSTALRSLGPVQAFNSIKGIIEDDEGFGDEVKQIVAGPVLTATQLASDAVDGDFSRYKRGVKNLDGDLLEELGSKALYDLGRTIGYGGVDPERPITSTFDTLTAPAGIAGAARGAAGAARGAARASKYAADGFHFRRLQRELANAGGDVKEANAAVRAAESESKLAAKEAVLTRRNLRAKKDRRALETPDYQRQAREGWDAQMAADPLAKELKQQAFKTLMASEHTPGVEAARGAMKGAKLRAAEQLAGDVDGIRAAQQHKSRVDYLRDRLQVEMGDIGENFVAKGLGEADKRLGQASFAGGVASVGGMLLGEGGISGALVAAGSASARKLLRSPRALGMVTNQLRRLASRNVLIARKLDSLGARGPVAPQALYQLHSQLMESDPGYAAAIRADAGFSS